MFYFAFSVIKFDPSYGGLIAIDDIVFTGYLCHEKMPAELIPSVPKIDLNVLFELQPFPKSTLNDFSDTLNCNFEMDFCSHWMHNYRPDDSEEVEKKMGFQYGFVPNQTPFFIDKELKGFIFKLKFLHALIFF